MPMNVGKRKANQLASSASESLGRHVTIVDFHKSEEVGKGFTVGWNPPKRSYGDKYGLFIENSSGNYGGMDLICTSDDINEIKVYLLGVETGASYRRA